MPVKESNVYKKDVEEDKFGTKGGADVNLVPEKIVLEGKFGTSLNAVANLPDVEDRDVSMAKDGVKVNANV